MTADVRVSDTPQVLVCSSAAEAGPRPDIPAHPRAPRTLNSPPRQLPRCLPTRRNCPQSVLQPCNPYSLIPEHSSGGARALNTSGLPRHTSCQHCCEARASLSHVRCPRASDVESVLQFTTRGRGCQVRLHACDLSYALGPDCGDSPGAASCRVGAVKSQRAWMTC